MPIQSEKGIDITPGNYQGEVMEVETRESQKKKFKKGHETTETIYYIVARMKTDNRETILEASWPAKITPQSSLGRLLDRFDMKPPEGETWDEKTLQGLRCKYVVRQDNQFVRIDEETVSPVE